MAQLKEKENIHFVNAPISAVMGSDSTKVKTGLAYLLKKHAPITCNGHFIFPLTLKKLRVIFSSSVMVFKAHMNSYISVTISPDAFVRSASSSVSQYRSK